MNLRIAIHAGFGRTMASTVMQKLYLSLPISSRTVLLAAAAVVIVSLFFPSGSPAREPEKDAFSISLVQEATVKKDQVGEVPYERHTVKKGEYLWQILRDKGLIPGPHISELLSAIKGINKSLNNLDLIHPGQTILIPLTIVPEKSYESEVDEFFQKSVMGFSSLEEVNLEHYVVKPGDSISKVVMSKYKMPPEYLYREYLDLVQKFNPTMKNLDLIYPHQVIRLPIYSPQIAKMPIQKPVKPAADKKTALKKTEPVVTPPAQKVSKTLALGNELRDIFSQMGEEWVDSGEQFIPLKSGGHVKLKAGSFPTLNLRNGRMVIIDLHNKLPENLARLIESDWQEYRVVRLSPHDNLKAALDKIFAASGYHDVRGPGEKLKLRSDIDITLAGDWVIIPQKGTGGTSESIITLNLIDNPGQRTPTAVRKYLKKVGITVIDHPDFPSPRRQEGETATHTISLEKGSRFPLPSLLLHLAGQPFSSDVKIPVYHSGETSFNLIIQADLFFTRGGRDCIIDTAGLSSHIRDLLAEHQFRVLSLAGEKEPCKITERLLGFLELEFTPGPHEFRVSSRNESRNITLTVYGIRFTDHNNRKILATDTPLPLEIASFLNQRGYHLLELGHLKGH